MKFLHSCGDLDLYEILSVSDLKRFIAFPDRLYIGNPNYVPSLMMDEMENLRKDKNPAFAYCSARYFMAFHGKEPVGRIAAIHNRRFNEIWHKNCVRFSRYDVIDDIEVSRALLAEVEAYAQTLGMTEVQGPMGFCDLDHQGLLVDGFDKKGLFITTYNHPYYMEHLEALGYAKLTDWVEMIMEKPETLDPRIKKIAEYSLEKLNLHEVHLKKTKEILPYAKDLFELLYEAYKNIYGVIPLDDKQVELYIGQFITLVKPEFLTLIVDENNIPVSFGVVIPSLADTVRDCKGRLFPFGWIHLLRYLTAKKHETLEFLLIATHPKYWNSALNAEIIVHSFEGVEKFGIKYAETGPMLETNLRIQSMWSRFHAEIHKRRRCYVKPLCENLPEESNI